MPEAGYGIELWQKKEKTHTKQLSGIKASLGQTNKTHTYLPTTFFLSVVLASCQRKLRGRVGGEEWGEDGRGGWGGGERKGGHHLLLMSPFPASFNPCESYSSGKEPTLTRNESTLQMAATRPWRAWQSCLSLLPLQTTGSKSFVRQTLGTARSYHAF